MRVLVGKHVLVRVVGATMVATLATSGVLTATATAEQPSPARPVASAAEESALTPEERASAQAVKSGGPVVVDELTTETTVVTAKPDRTFTAEISVEPVRAADEQGGWSEIDPTLKAASGVVEPKSVLGDLILSNGGPAGSRIASYTPVDGKPITLTSPWALPKPTLSENFATYAEVLPGVDLVVQASADGFSHNWVVKNASAAADPRVRNIKLGLDLGGLRPEHRQGGVMYVDAEGYEVLWTPTPTAWDSSGADSSAKSKDAVEGGPDRGDQVGKVAMTFANGQTSLRAPAGVLNSDSTEYPVVIDPTYTKPPNGWTAAWSNFPNTSFWKTDHTLGAGYEGWEQNKIVRSYYRFYTSPLIGKKILTAEVNIPNVHAAQCAPHPTDMYRTGSISERTTWNNQPTRYGLMDSNSAYGGCGPDTMNMGFNVKPGIETASDHNYDTTTFMVRGRDETDKYGWKQFDGSGAELSVEYVSYPNKPSGLKVNTGNSSHWCETNYDEAPLTSSDEVRLRATPRSADWTSANMHVVFQRRLVGQTAYPEQVRGPTTDNTGLELSWGNLTNYTYAFKAKSRSLFGPGLDSSIDSGWTDWCYFKVDLSRPKAPVIDGGSLEECADPADPLLCLTNPVAGTVPSFSVTGDASAAKYVYRYRHPNSTVLKTGEVTAASGGAKTVIPGLRALSGLNELVVWAKNAVGTSGEADQFKFKAGNTSAVGDWDMDGSPTISIPSEGRDPSPLTLNAATSSQTGRVAESIKFAWHSNPASANKTVLNTTNDFTVAGWVRMESATSAATLFSAPEEKNSALSVWYDPATQRWNAGRFKTANTSEREFVSSLADRPLGVWTHVAAVYDKSFNNMRLYVNGRVQGTVGFSAAPRASTAFWIGCDRWNYAPNNCLRHGEVDEVKTFDLAMSTEELQAELMDPVVNDNPVASPAGAWAMNDASDGVYGSPITVTGAGSEAYAGGCLAFGSRGADSATTQGTVVDISASFTIETSVFIDAAAAERPQVIARQSAGGQDAWSLAYIPEAGGHRWRFSRSGSFVLESGLRPGTPGETTHLVVSYSASRKEFELFVNGKHARVDGEVVLANYLMVTTLGKVILGNGSIDGVAAPLEGAIGELGLYAGEIPDNGVLPEFDTKDECPVPEPAA